MLQNQKVLRSLYLVNMSVNRDLKVSRIISETINIEMELDEKILVFGEDVGKLGGVFATTIGLQKKFDAQLEKMKFQLSTL